MCFDLPTTAIRIFNGQAAHDEVKAFMLENEAVHTALVAPASPRREPNSASHHRGGSVGCLAEYSAGSCDQ